ncbi:HsdM family class I SAM-dependent methyltransferase [Aquibacillus saliphilus]|uniref:HsdM family class I SAM-dependent methyltransferase n=1 Tax=Aquibacillus saliphilus TaxID=1909422 RepID=UPI001CF008EF|nr:N-6 DNA methylase [Aquibacillus saliphilus]
MKKINSIEQSYINSTTLSHRKQFGQYFTPDFISDILAKWITFNNPFYTTILDPAIGLGNLIQSFPHNTSIVGFDRDQDILDFTRTTCADFSNLHLQHQDFLESSWGKTYDGIVCNPPYHRFRQNERKQYYLDLLEQQLGIKFSGFTNIYTLFIIKALHQLSNNGRASFIVPSDFMNSNYGVKIKQYLLKQNNLHLVVTADFHLSLFEQAATTSSLFFFDNQVKANTIEFIHLTDLSQLNAVEDHIENFYDNQPIGKRIDYQELSPNKKWKEYYQQENRGQYAHLKPLSEFGKVTRGIATGANQFFCINETDRKQHQLNKAYFVPCLTKSHQVTGNFFTTVDYDKLLAKNLPVQLLQVNEDDLTDVDLKRYIELGETAKINQRYLTKHRNPWYKSETRSPAPILVNVFSRNNLKFIRNEANVSNLTAFHCIYLNDGYLDEIDLFMAYFMTDISKEILGYNFREYGKGLKKFEPGDLNQGLIIDVDTISEQDKRNINHLYAKIRKNQDKDTVSQASDLERLNALFVKLLSTN